MAVRRWEDLSGPEITAIALDHQREVALLPVGATEQHGPHLPEGTDTYVPSHLAEIVARHTRSIDVVEPHLVLLGLRRFYESQRTMV